jgi:hypothetical protein
MMRDSQQADAHKARGHLIDDRVYLGYNRGILHHFRVMRRLTMVSNQTHLSSTEPQLTLVDIEELRKILGAEADLGADTFIARLSTCMCPAHPWDNTPRPDGCSGS